MSREINKWQFQFGFFLSAGQQPSSPHVTTKSHRRHPPVPCATNIKKSSPQSRIGEREGCEPLHPTDYFMFHRNRNHTMQKDHQHRTQRTTHPLNMLRASGLATLGTLMLGAGITSFIGDHDSANTAHVHSIQRTATLNNNDPNNRASITPPRTIDPFMQKGLHWLADAQHKDGGWGA